MRNHDYYNHNHYNYTEHIYWIRIPYPSYHYH